MVIQKLNISSKIKSFKSSKFIFCLFFRNGKFAWDFNERDENKIFNFMKDPSEPPAPEPEWSDEPSSVVQLNDESFSSFLKTKKHALVMFYAPCKKN
jgi:hypothetical protein